MDQPLRDPRLRDLRPQDAWSSQSTRETSGEVDFELIELMFFAYRDFVRDADLLLEGFGFGRAHHRVLHFVSRRPGLSIAELLDILQITKQSLNRVLKDLLDQGYVDAAPGESDRRQRRLYATAQGRALACEAARVQSKRFARVFDGPQAPSRAAALSFLLAMIDEGGRDVLASAATRPGAPARRARKA